MSVYTEPNWNSSILITIDTQNDFTLPNAPAQIQGTLEVIPNITQLLECYRTIGLPIVHVVRLYKEDGSNVDISRKEAVENGAKIAIPYSDGAELVVQIRPPEAPSLDADALLSGQFQQLGDKEWAMYKPRWGAFYGTDLESFLHRQGIDTLVFAGCNFPNCPRTSIYEASERDFRIVMAADAMSQVYDRGVQEMSRIGVHVYSTQDIIRLVSSLGPEFVPDNLSFDRKPFS